METTVKSRSDLLQKHIALPQDHGSWVFLFSPLLIGLFAGGSWSLASLYLIIAALAAFLVRQPVTIAVKAYSKRRSRRELPAARFWMLVYGAVALLALLGLVLQGYAYLLYLAIPGVPVFAFHLWLVSRRQERRQMGIELVATGVLALTAPAAYWVGMGQYHPAGWALFALAWLQSAASIVYAYLRLEQRAMDHIPAFRERLHMAARALAYTSFNLALVTVLAATGRLPWALPLPFLLQWLETVYGSLVRPAVKVKPTIIGIRQLVVSTLFTIAFILAWNL